MLYLENLLPFRLGEECRLVTVKIRNRLLEEKVLLCLVIIRHI